MTVWSFQVEGEPRLRVGKIAAENPALWDLFEQLRIAAVQCTNHRAIRSTIDLAKRVVWKTLRVVCDETWATGITVILLFTIRDVTRIFAQGGDLRRFSSYFQRLSATVVQMFC